LKTTKRERERERDTGEKENPLKNELKGKTKNNASKLLASFNLFSMLKSKRNANKYLYL
jgi:hypothetical protein